MANHQLGKINKQPFLPTIFYNIFESNFIFLAFFYLKWSPYEKWQPTNKMILLAGFVQPNKNMFCSQNRIKLEVFTKLQTGVQGV